MLTMLIDGALETMRKSLANFGLFHVNMFVCLFLRRIFSGRKNLNAILVNDFLLEMT